MILLDARTLIVDVQGGYHPLSNYARTESAGCAAADAAIKDHLHLARPSDIQVLPNHLLEEDPPGDRAVQNLGQRELGLQNGELLAVTGLPILGGKGVRQLAEPLAQQGVDLLSR